MWILFEVSSRFWYDTTSIKDPVLSQDAKDDHACTLFKKSLTMIGIDLIKTPRMRDMMERFGDKALARFLSGPEIVLAKNYRTAAGFWAAKEACSKALGTGIGKECGFHDITISKTAKGAPVITLAEHLLKTYHIRDISLSITHDGDYAVAVVTIESDTAKTLY